MGWFVFNLLFMSVVAGLTARTDLFPPARLTWAAERGETAVAPATSGLFDGPRRIAADSLGPVLTAPAAALVDTRSGAMLFTQGHDRVVPIASITKLMTALVFLENAPDWNAVLTIEAQDQEKEGIPYLKIGDAQSIRDVFLTTMIGSANNGALALARSSGLPRERFVTRMNAKARELGLMHTTFVDPSGYGPGNASTVHDVARLAYHAFQSPELLEALAMKEHHFRTAQGREIRVPSTNTLLTSFLNDGEHQIAGGKTGYTEEAGYTLVLRARKGEADVIGVVLGSTTSEDRFQDLKALLAWGFDSFDWASK